MTTVAIVANVTACCESSLVSSLGVALAVEAWSVMFLVVGEGDQKEQKVK